MEGCTRADWTGRKHQGNGFCEKNIFNFWIYKNYSLPIYQHYQKPTYLPPKTRGKRVNLLLLTAPGRTGVMNTRQAEPTPQGRHLPSQDHYRTLARQGGDVVILNRTSSIWSCSICPIPTSFLSRQWRDFFLRPGMDVHRGRQDAGSDAFVAT